MHFESCLLVLHCRRVGYTCFNEFTLFSFDETGNYENYFSQLCLIRTFLGLGIAGFKVVMQGKTFLDVFVLFCFVEPRILKCLCRLVMFLNIQSFVINNGNSGSD